MLAYQHPATYGSTRQNSARWAPLSCRFFSEIFVDPGLVFEGLDGFRGFGEISEIVYNLGLISWWFCSERRLHLELGLEH